MSKGIVIADLNMFVIYTVAKMDMLSSLSPSSSSTPHLRGGGGKRDSYVYIAYAPKCAKYVRIIYNYFLYSYESLEQFSWIFRNYGIVR